MRLALGLLVTPLLLGCVTGDDTSGKPQGSLGGPCYANNTCNAGLTCMLENGGGVCEEPDATLDVSVDQVTSDGPASDAADAGDSTTPCDAGVATKACPTSNCAAQDAGCCVQSDSCGNDVATCNGSPWWCESRDDCNGGGAPCCLTLTVVDLTVCPPTYAWDSQGQGAQCSFSTSCPTNTVAICRTDQDCFGKTCVTVQINTLQSAHLGVCL
jgi:hypothetical protein